MKRLLLVVLLISVSGCAAWRPASRAGYYGIKMTPSDAQFFKVRSYDKTGLRYEMPVGADASISVRGYGEGNYLRLEIFNDSKKTLHFDYAKDSYALKTASQDVYPLQIFTKEINYPSELKPGERTEFKLYLDVGGIEKKDVAGIECRLSDGTFIFLKPVYFNP
jgi:hypothetical protein